MTIYSTFGVIHDVIQVQNAYYKLTVCVNTPFRTDFLKFKVWRKELLKKYESVMFDKGDEISMKYHYKDSTPYLDNLSPASIDHCPVCYNALEATDAQRFECDGCSLYPESERKVRINKPMKVMSLTTELYAHSSGIRLELLPQGESKLCVAVVFPNELHYSSISKFKVGEIYYTLGWKSGNDLDIVDICW